MAIENPKHDQPLAPSSRGLGTFLNGPNKPMTPLFIMAGLIVLVDIVLAVGVIGTNGTIRLMLAAFVIIFPLLFLVGFFILLFFRPAHLYSPSEYGVPSSAPEFLGALRPIPVQVTEAEIEIRPRGSLAQAGDGSRDIEVSDSEDIVQLGMLSAKNGDTTASSPEELFYQVAFSTESDLAALEVAYADIQSNDFVDSETRAKLEIAYLEFRFRKGDGSALRKLQEKASTTNEEAPEAWLLHYSLGNCLLAIGSVELAIAAYSVSLQRANRPLRQVLSTTQIAESYKTGGNSQEAERYIRESVRTADDSEVRSGLLGWLADLLEESVDKVGRALALAKAQELQPSNVSTLFNTARAFQEAGFPKLSLIYYRTILAIAPRNNGAHNNIAIDLEGLGLPINAVDHYLKAHHLGDGLASANLAQTYLNAGFYDQARESLRGVEVGENADPHVGTVAARISEARQNEAERLEQLVDEANRQRRFFQEYAARTLGLTVEPGDFRGTWLVTVDGTVHVAIVRETLDADTLTCSWTSGDRRFSFEITANMGAGTITPIEGVVQDSKSYRSPTPITDNDGWIILDDDGARMRLMSVLYGKSVFLEFLREGGADSSSDAKSDRH